MENNESHSCVDQPHLPCSACLQAMLYREVKPGLGKRLRGIAYACLTVAALGAIFFVLEMLGVGR